MNDNHNHNHKPAANDNKSTEQGLRYIQEKNAALFAAHQVWIETMRNNPT